MSAASDVNAGLLTELVALGRSMVGRRDTNAAPMVFSERPDGMTVRVGDVVVKAHAPGTDPRALASRLRVATDPRLRSVLLPPICVRPKRARDRLVTVWPAGEPVHPDDLDAAPWDQAALLLARLHATPADAVFGSDRQLAAGGPSRLSRAMARLRAARDSSVKRDVLAAFATLPPAVHNGTGNILVHGDWHLGQLVRWRGGPEAGVDHWRLIDVDDLGIGNPAWDLARPAAWYAAGLFPAEVWLRFLDSYRASGGCAVPAASDPWLALDVPARALAVQSAALAVVKADRDGRAPFAVVGCAAVWPLCAPPPQELRELTVWLVMTRPPPIADSGYFDPGSVGL